MLRTSSNVWILRTKFWSPSAQGNHSLVSIISYKMLLAFSLSFVHYEELGNLNMALLRIKDFSRMINKPDINR